MAKLETLRQALENAMNAAKDEINIVNNTFRDLDDVKSFVTDVLSATGLTSANPLKIEDLAGKPLLDTGIAGQITVQGKSNILLYLLNAGGGSGSFPKTDFTIVFTEPVEDQLDLDVTVVVPQGTTATFGFLPSFQLGSPDQDLVMNLTKTGSEFGMSLTGADGDPVALPGVSAVANLTEGSGLDTLVPESLFDAISGIAFNDLRVKFNPSDSTVSLLGVDLQYLFNGDASGNWNMAPGVGVSGLRFAIEVENAVPAPGDTRLPSAIIQGTLNAGGTDVPLELSTANAATDLWTAGIQAGETVVMPTLGDLLNTMLDTATLDTIPAPVKDIPGITIDALTVEFDPRRKTDPQEKTIKNLRFDISLGSDWELAPGFLSTQNNRLAFDIENLLDSVNRTIAGTAESTLTVAGAPFAFLLEKTADAENWTMSGALEDGASLPLSEIVNEFLSGVSVPATIPDFSIDEAGFTVELTDKHVTFHAASTEGLEIVTGFQVNNLGLDIDHTPAATPGGQATTTGELLGTILVAGIDLNLRALLEQGAGSGSDITFETSAATGSAIPIGNLISDLAAFGSITVPASIDGALLSNIISTYQVGKELTFGFDVSLETDGKSVIISVLLRMSKNGTSWTKVFEGLVTAGDLEFDVSFSQSASEKSFYASLRPGGVGEMDLRNLLLNFVDDPNNVIPSLTVSLNEAFVAYNKETTQPKGTLLFGVSVGAGMTFSDLPLVGPMLNGQTIGVDSVMISYATSSLTMPQVRKMNLSIPANKPKLPEIDLNSGVGMSLLMAFGKLKQYMALPVAEQAPPSSPGTPAPAPTQPERDGKWFPVGKKMGPLSIDRIGINLKDAKLIFGLDATVAVGPLTLLLEEMTLGSPLDHFAPEFGLRGFGLGYSAGPVSISGFFLRNPTTEEYAGAALIQTSKLTLKAVGAYAMTANGPSFYLYAYLGYPIGGPAFFFVEGLAAGFGFNRSVRTPEIGDVKTFPLVAIAVGDEDFLTVAERMATGGYVPIDPGKIFLAVGVRFTTFKQLDSFLLIIATFGDSFRLDLLGLSKLVVPAPVPGAAPKTPLAEIELAIKGTFAPAEGFVGVQAQLTKNSYILSRDCTLTGGFAFFTWFAGSPHEGDFVISLGGYHPQFSRPSHYPVVPRLGLNWTLTKEITIKGQLYFALTPVCVMAGGRLEATFKSGGLKAWFIIGADFIIGWKPYMYDARIYLNMGVSYTFWFFGKQTVSFDIGADLHIWGPEFSGTAYIDLGIVDFTVEFGAGASQTVNPINYSEFKETFLPGSNLATVSIVSGLLKEDNLDAAGNVMEIGNNTTPAEKVWVVSPKEFELNTDSAIPAKTVQGITLPATISQNFGIGTMDVGNSGLETFHTITITKDGEDVSGNFLYDQITKSYPAALWGNKLKPDKNDTRTINGLLSGVKIKARPPLDPDQMGFLDQGVFTFQMLQIQRDAVGAGLSFAKTSGPVTVPASNADRDKILASLGFDAAQDFETGGNTDDDLALAGLHDPVVGSYS
ncbi:MAG: hypothetical protein H6565_09150 [Lewinellaceae bacterium]|nr:hypothetical protein [Lewinellaceae bacterium]